jgi:hypothetical protein
MTPRLMDDWGWFVVRLPLCTVCLIGFILALVRWQRHPITSLLTVLGTGILAFNSLVWWIVPDRLVTTDNVTEIFVIHGFARHFLTAAGVALLVAAVFSPQSRRPIVTRDDQLSYQAPDGRTPPSSNRAPDGAFRKGDNL